MPHIKEIHHVCKWSQKCTAEAVIRGLVFLNKQLQWNKRYTWTGLAGKSDKNVHFTADPWLTTTTKSIISQEEKYFSILQQEWLCN